MEEEIYYLDTFPDDASIKEAVAHLKDDDIMAMAQEHIAYRGYDYYQEGYVEKYEEKAEKLIIRVEGSYGNHYKVILFEDDQDLVATCTCPYDDTCKHIIASLLYIKNNDEKKKETSEDTPQEKELFLEQLNKMEKNELISLVDRFAPACYRKNVIVHHLPKEEVSASLEKIQRSIQHTLNNNELMFDPKTLQDVVLEHMEILSTHIDVMPQETFNIIVWFIGKLEESEDEGYMYQESYHWYHEDLYFEHDEVSNSIIKMIETIKDPKIQAEIVLEYARLCSNSQYYDLNFSDLDIADRSLLLPGLEEIEDLHFYAYVKSYIPFEEKIAYLQQFESSKVVSEMMDAYVQHGEKEKALAYIESLLAEKFTVSNAELFLHFIPPQQLEKTRLSTLVRQAIMSDDYSAHAFITSHIKQCDAQEELEKMLKKHKVHWYYQYLKKDERVEEMHTVLEKVAHEKTDFYRRYKQLYQEEAIDFYKAGIQENLPFTGNDHYSKIGSYLEELRPLISKEEFDTMLIKLKSEFKRRRNFVKILNEKFNITL